MNKKEFRGGNSAIVVNGVVIATSNGCPRIILLRSEVGQPEPDLRTKATFMLGEMSEKYVEYCWKKSGIADLQTDVEVREKISDNVDLVGHIDAIKEGMIYEEKSISSTSVYEKVFKKGVHKAENVIQLCQYLLAKEQTEGRLLYTNYIYHEGSKPGEQREFVVKIKKNGVILVNRCEQFFGVNNILEHREIAREVLENNKIWPKRPEPIEPPWSPCNGCWAKEACDNWEQSQDDARFLETCKKIIETSKLDNVKEK